MTGKKGMKKWSPSDWQLDPANITTDNVQLWSKSGTMNGIITKDQAIEMLNDPEKKVFVIAGQAIGWY